MASATRLGVLIVCCCFLVSVPSRSDERPRVLEHYRLAGDARARKDFTACVAHLKAALAAAPSHPGLMADLARAYRDAGQPRLALESLDRAVTLEGGLEVLDDPEFVRLLDAPDQKSIRARVDALRRPLGRSEVAFQIRERDLIPEGIAFDPASGTFLLSSIYKRKIVRVDAARRTTDFVAPMQDGLLSVLGLRVDAPRGVLWVATEASESMIDARPSDRDRSAVFKYDLRTAKLLKAYWAEQGSGRRLFNDVAVDSRGTALITDSEEGSLYVIRPETDRLERAVGPSAWEYPNGVTLSEDERTAYVAHVSGIAAVDLGSRTWRDLTPPAGATVVGIDGLYRLGRTLIGVQNGVTPMRIVRLTLNGTGDRVSVVETIERNHPAFNIPTTGVLVGHVFHYIANSQLSAFTPDHKILPPERLQDVMVLKVAVGDGSPGANPVATGR